MFSYTCKDGACLGGPASIYAVLRKSCGVLQALLSLPTRFGSMVWGRKSGRMLWAGHGRTEQGSMSSSVSAEAPAESDRSATMPNPISILDQYAHACFKVLQLLPRFERDCPWLRALGCQHSTCRGDQNVTKDCPAIALQISAI